MSEIDYKLLETNIRSLMDKKGITQNKLAEAIGMPQSNISKALNCMDDRKFSLEQLYRISQYFGVSIDELLGNKPSEEKTISLRSLFSMLVDLLVKQVILPTKTEVEEWVYEPIYDVNGYPDCRPEKKKNVYISFFFPNYFCEDAEGLSEEEKDELEAEYLQCGNDTRYVRLNEVVRDILPMIDLYRKKRIPEEAFQMIVNGYLDKLK